MAMSRSAFATTIGVLLAAVLAVGPVGCGKPTAPVPSQLTSLNLDEKPVTEEESLAAAEAIRDAVYSGDPVAIDRMIDWDYLGQKSTADIGATEQFRSDFIEGIDRARLEGKGFSQSIVEAINKGASYTLIHGHVKERRRWLLFRLVHPAGGVNYHDLPLARRLNGKIKAVDIYVYMSGELISEGIRRLYIQAAAQATPGIIDRLTGEDQKFAKFVGKLKEMGDALRTGRFAEVLDIDKSLAPELKKERSVLLIRRQAAQKLGDDAEYSRSIEDYRKEHPTDACIDIISIDYYIMKKQYSEALACVDRLDRAVLGDPYLQSIRAAIHIEENDLAAARSALRKAIDSEPDLAEAYWSVVTVSLKDKNYDETLQTLRIIRDKLGTKVADLTAVPLYKEFLGSPQYQEWLKENQGGVSKDDGEEPAGKPED